MTDINIYNPNHGSSTPSVTPTQAPAPTQNARVSINPRAVHRNQHHYLQVTGHTPRRGLCCRFASGNLVAGKKTGETYVMVRGRFAAVKTARLFYSLVTHFFGTPSSQDCGARVTGTARTY